MEMYNFTHLVQLAIAISVAFVWIFRFHNVEKEFKQFELSLVTRSFVGFSKTALATLLVVGIWHSELVFIPAVLMAFFMLSAQFFHFKIKNPFIRHLPSLILLILSLFVAYQSY
jgi:tellurite resistance protein TehA-like permease